MYQDPDRISNLHTVLYTVVQILQLFCGQHHCLELKTICGRGKGKRCGQTRKAIVTLIGVLKEVSIEFLSP